MNYVTELPCRDHLDRLIVKSTFKVDHPKLPLDCFISPEYGVSIIRCDSHHHVEVALEILGRISEPIKADKEIAKSQLKIYERIINLIESDELNKEFILSIKSK